MLFNETITSWLFFSSLPFDFSQKTKQRSFTSSSVYKSYDPNSAGTLSLKDYKTLEDRKKYVEGLEQYGLTEEEIQFKLEQEGYLPKVRKSENLIHPTPPLLVSS